MLSLINSAAPRVPANTETNPTANCSGSASVRRRCVSNRPPAVPQRPEAIHAAASSALTSAAAAIHRTTSASVPPNCFRISSSLLSGSGGLKHRKHGPIPGGPQRMISALKSLVEAPMIRAGYLSCIAAREWLESTAERTRLEAHSNSTSSAEESTGTNGLKVCLLCGCLGSLRLSERSACEQRVAIQIGIINAFAVVVRQHHGAADSVAAHKQWTAVQPTAPIPAISASRSTAIRPGPSNRERSLHTGSKLKRMSNLVPYTRFQAAGQT